MGKNRDLNPLDPLPADQVDALNEFIGTLVSPNFELRIRASDATVLEVPAGPGMDQVTAGVGDPADATKARWRWITATVSRAGLAGAARTQDVWITANENSFAPGTPGEVDNTDYSFALAITEAGAVPAGALKRKIGSATWDGAKFTATAPLVGKGGAANTTQVVKVVGDGTVGPFDFIHGLGTYDCAVEVYESTSPRSTLDVRVERPTVDSVRILPDVPIGASGAVIVVSSRGRAAGAVPAHGSTHLPGVGADPTGLPVVTSAAGLAATPLVHGSEVYFLADQAAGVMWHLRCRLWQADGVTPNPSAYKWDVIGGRPITVFSDPSASTTTSVAPATAVGASLVLPLAGDYDIDYETRENFSTVPTTGGIYTYSGFVVPAGVAWSTGDYMVTREATLNGATQQVQGKCGFSRKTGLAAGVTVRNALMTQAGATVFSAGHQLRAMPVRVG